MTESELKLRGKMISGGVALGRACIVEVLPPASVDASIGHDQVGAEVARFDAAAARARRHLEAHVSQHHSSDDDAMRQIIAAHLLILSDEIFLRSITERIARDMLSAERAVELSYRDAASRLAASRDEYLRARVEDLRDSSHLLVEALYRGEAGFPDAPDAMEDAIIVAPHLHASLVLRARRAGVIGFVTSSDAYMSHGAILLRAGGIPSIGGVALGDLLTEEGIPILVDADRGEVVVNPTLSTRGRVAQDRGTKRSDPDPPPMNVRTNAGREVVLLANIDDPSQTEQCLECRLHGIGLFRTEFMALAEGKVPQEEAQYGVYKRVAERMNGRPLVIRTFDIGAEKVPAALRDDIVLNPALALRGLRRHLARFPDELRTQFRAILRATVGTDAAVLLPMVTRVADVQEARTHLQAVLEELRASGVQHNERMKVASMIEVPAAALNIEAILEVVDFVVVGTNDLSQYLTAADRDNASVSAYLEPESSGILRMIEYLLERADRVGRKADVLIAGELASDPVFVKQLLELGVSGLIVNPSAAERLRVSIASASVETAKAASQRQMRAAAQLQ